MKDESKLIKSFVKKKAKYTISLFVIFMITGSLGYGDVIIDDNSDDIDVVRIWDGTERGEVVASDDINFEFDLTKERQSFLYKLKKLKEEIQKKIWQNKMEIKNLNYDLFTLVDMGNYYSKPVWESNEIFFSYNYYDEGMGVDNTPSEFKETIDAGNKYFSDTNIKLYNGNGTLVNANNSPLYLRLGARIVPLDVKIDIHTPKAPDVDINYQNNEDKIKDIVINDVNIVKIDPKEIPFTKPTLPPLDGTINPITLGVTPNKSVIPNIPNKIVVDILPRPVLYGVKKLDVLDVTFPTLNVKRSSPPVSNWYPIPFTFFYPNTPWYLNSIGTFQNGYNYDVSYVGIKGTEWYKQFNPKIGEYVPLVSEYSPRAPIIQNINLIGGEFWNGIDKNGVVGEFSEMENVKQGKNWTVPEKALANNSINTRHWSTIALNNRGRLGKILSPNKINSAPQIIENVSLHINGAKGNYNWNNPDPSDKKYYEKVETRKYGTGTVAFYVGGDATIKNSKVELFDKSAFLYNYCAWGGEVNVKDVKIDVKKDKTTIFYVMQTNPGHLSWNEMRFSNSLNNSLDLNIKTKENMVNLFAGYTMDMKFTQIGKTNIEGYKNVYLGVDSKILAGSQYILPLIKKLDKDKLGKIYNKKDITDKDVENYIFNKDLYAGYREKNLKDFDSYIKMDKDNPVNFYGDDNIGLYMSDSGKIIAPMDLYFTFGEKLNPKDTGPQISTSNLESYSEWAVDEPFAVKSYSGQRAGESIDVDGIKITYPNLTFDKFNFKFGKYAKNGVMFWAGTGTIIDIVPKNSLRDDDFEPQISFSDGIDGVNTKLEDTSQGLILTYGYPGGSLSPKTADSQIRIYQNIDMMSREGVALTHQWGEVGFWGYQDPQHKIKPRLTAHGYSSVITFSYLKTQGFIYVDKNAEIYAEAITPTELTIAGKTIHPLVNGKEIDEPMYNNVGAYSSSGEINFYGKAKIKGIGAVGQYWGNITMSNSENEITVGKGMAGVIAYKTGDRNKYGVNWGGKIISDRDDTMPFYAEDGGIYAEDGRITFLDTYQIKKWRNFVNTNGESEVEIYTEPELHKTHTIIEMKKGLVFQDYRADKYSKEINKQIKFSGMKNVDLNIEDSSVIIAVIKSRQDYVYKDSSIEEEINEVTKIPVSQIHISKNQIPKIVMVGNRINIQSNIDLDNPNSKFKNFSFLRNTITLDENYTISSKKGTGIVIARNPRKDYYSRNGDTQFINRGTIDISGGNENSFGITIPFGITENYNTINVEKGSGIIGVNGATITNKKGASITVGEGQGIVGISTENPNDLSNYGTSADGLNRFYSIDITNQGQIDIKNGIGIYANNNYPFEKGKFTTYGTNVNNSGSINIKENGIGVKTIGVNYTGNGKITINKRGIGVMLTKTSNWTNTNLNFDFKDTSTNPIGVYVDSTSTVSILNSTKIKWVYNGDSRPIGLYYKDALPNLAPYASSINGENFKNGILIYADFTEYKKENDISNSRIPSNVGENGIGWYIKNGIYSNKSSIELNKNNGIGIYGDNSDILGIHEYNYLTLNGDNTIGIYVNGDGRIAQDKLSDYRGYIGLNGEGSIGIMATNGATAQINKATSIKLTGDKSNQKITTAIGGNINLKIDYDFIQPSGKNRNFAYLKDGSNMVIDTDKVLKISGQNIESENKTTGIVMTNNNSFTGKLDVTDGSIGIFATNGNTIDMDGSVITKTNDPMTIGVISSDNNTIKPGTITIKNGAVGIFGKSGNTVFDNTLLNLSGDKTIGSYLPNNTTISGDVNAGNLTPQIREIAIFYKNDTTMVNHDANINLVGENIVGLYLDSDAKVKSNKNITSQNFANNIGAYISGEFSTSGNIITRGSDNIGLYVLGTAESSGMIDNTGSDKPAVIVDGKFTSTGTVKGKIGIYLNQTNKDSIKLNILDIANGGIGVVADNSFVDFDVSEIKGDNIIGIYAKGNSTINGLNATLTGKNNVGLYVTTPNISIQNSTIKSNGKVGILLTDENNTNKDFTITNTSVDTTSGVGILINEPNKTLNLTGGTVTNSDGLGVKSVGSTIKANGTIFNIKNNGTGIYVEKGNLEASDLTFNFTGEKNLGIYGTNSKIKLNGTMTLTGSGSGDMLSTLNSTIISNVQIMGDNKNALVSHYDSTTTTDQIISNDNIINITNGKGIVALSDKDNPTTAKISIDNKGEITIGGQDSIGIYSDIAKDIKNTNKIISKNGAAGIYATDSSDITNNDIELQNGRGITVNKSIINFTNTNIHGSGIGVLFKDVKNTDINSINLGVVSLDSGENNVGFVAQNSDINKNITGAITTLGKNSVGVISTNSKLNLDTNIVSDNLGIKIENGTVSAKMDKITINNSDGIFVVNQKGTFNFSGDFEVSGNQKGIISNGGVLNGNSKITVKKGAIGIYADNSADIEGVTHIDVISQGVSTVGGIFKNISAINFPTFSLNGDSAIGLKLIGNTGKVGDFTLGNGNNQIGIRMNENSNITIGKIDIQNGNKNMGVYGVNSNLTAKGDILVADNNTGIYLNKSRYNGTANNINVGNNGIGVLLLNTNSDITQTATNMNIGEKGIGIYGDGSGKIILKSSNGINLGESALAIYSKNMDIVAEGNIKVGSRSHENAQSSIGVMLDGDGNITYKGDMEIGVKGIGIYKINNKNNSMVTVSGNNWSIGRGGYGIYAKYGNGVDIKNSANMKLGDSAVGIAAIGKNEIVNSGTITTGKTYIPIDPKTNKQTTDFSKYESSVGIFLDKGAKATSSGVLNVKEENSVGVYGASSGTEFTNMGTINVDNGGIGVLIRNGAKVINKGIINVNNNGKGKSVGIGAYGTSYVVNEKEINVSGNNSVGIYTGQGVVSTGDGKINTKGNGKSTDDGSDKLPNGGITIKDGKIVFGDKIIQGGGVLRVDSQDKVKQKTNVIFKNTKLILEKYLNTLKKDEYVFQVPNASGNIDILPSAVLTGNGINWRVENFIKTVEPINGGDLKVSISPIFNLGIYKGKDNELQGSLEIVKKPYRDLVIGDQFTNLFDGLDNILVNSKGITYKGIVLKKMDYYLSVLSQIAEDKARDLKFYRQNEISILTKKGYKKDKLKEKYYLTLNDWLSNGKITQKEYEVLKTAGLKGEIKPDMAYFTTETEKLLSEYRGDAYATIKTRMEDINRSFDTSFDEIYDSYDYTKNANKYSVIYSGGRYRNETLAIPNYRYNIYGILYGKVYEGLNYRGKWGYVGGFSVSDFLIDDPGNSKERVYSVRTGAFKYKYLSKKHRIGILTRLNVNINRHFMKRVLDIKRIGLNSNIRNSGDYTTGSIRMSAKLNKMLYQDFGKSINLYAGTRLEFGRIYGFNESGDFKLHIQRQNWKKWTGSIGIRGKYDIYIKDNYMIKTLIGGEWVHAFSNNFQNVRARLENGETGYYNLIAPKTMRDKVIGKFGLGLQKGDDYGVMLEFDTVKQNNKNGIGRKYSIRFNYTFN